MQVMPKPGGGSGVHQWKSPAGLVFPGRRGRREQQHGPSATRSCLPGVQSVIVPPAVSDDRSEGELSVLDGDEDQGHLAAMDSGSAAGGPSPVLLPLLSVRYYRICWVRVEGGPRYG